MEEVKVTINEQGLTRFIADKLLTHYTPAGTPEQAEDTAFKTAEIISAFCWETMNHNIDIAKGHLELFIYRIQKMRDVQKQFFEGKKSALKTAQQLEAKVDMAIEKMLGPMGYSIEKIKQKEEQSKLF